MGRKRPARRALAGRDDRFVHRGNPPETWRTRLGGLAVVAIIPMIMLVGIGIGAIFGARAHPWWAVFFGPAVFFTFWSTVMLVLMWADSRGTDREGIALLIDEAGIYLGGRRPRRLDWEDVRRVRLIHRRRTHMVEFGLLRGRRRRVRGLDAGALDDIARAVAQYAPDIPVARSDG